MESLVKGSDFLQNFIDAVPSLLFMVDRDVRVLHCNLAASRAIGMQNEAVMMKRGGEVLHCLHAAETAGGCGHSPHCGDCVIRNSVGRAFDGEEVFGISAVMDLLKEGQVIRAYFKVTAEPMTYQDRRFVLLLLDDVTRLKEAEQALSDRDNQLRNIVSVVGEGILGMNRDGLLTFMNPEAERLLGWKEAELLGKNVHEIIHYQNADGTPIPLAQCAVRKSIISGRPYRVSEDCLTRKDGVVMLVSFACNPVMDGDRVEGSVAAFHDITGIKEAYEALNRANRMLERQATTDPLTGICNRLKFDELLMNEINRSKRHKIPLSLIMFDVDHFKKINDTYGHHIGDAVLQQLATHVSQSMRKHDLFARWGGEEFMILLTHSTREAGARFSEKLRAGIEALLIRGLQKVTCSFGITQLRPDDDIFSLTKRADEALYRAKAGGRNRVEAL